MTSRLRKFLALPRADKALLVETGCLLGAIRAGLSVLPFRVLRRAVMGLAGAARRPRRAAAERVGWAVSLAGRHLPACRGCLVQALAAEALLRRRGCPARLRLGVARAKEGKLEAHAWVESAGRAVVGASAGLSRFRPLRAAAASNP